MDNSKIMMEALEAKHQHSVLVLKLSVATSPVRYAAHLTKVLEEVEKRKYVEAFVLHQKWKNKTGVDFKGHQGVIDSLITIEWFCKEFSDLSVSAALSEKLADLLAAVNSRRH